MKRFRHAALWLIALAFIMGLRPARQPPAARVVVVIHSPALGHLSQVNGLRAGLEELNYVEGENLKLRLIHDANLPLLRDRLKSELRHADTRLIIALGTTETVIAREVAGSMPIVFMPALDPVQSGFVQSLATPRTNLTGLAFLVDSQSVGKQLEIFKQVVPSLRDVVALTDGRPETGMNDPMRSTLYAAALRLGINLTEKAVNSAEESRGAALSAANLGPSSGLFVVCTGLFRSLVGLAEAAIRARAPLFGCSAAQVAEQKVLMTYAPDLYALGYRGAWYVDQILKGVAPHSLAVETPRKFDLVINLKAAQRIGLKLPPEVLVLADRVFD